MSSSPTRKGKRRSKKRVTLKSLTFAQIMAQRLMKTEVAGAVSVNTGAKSTAHVTHSHDGHKKDHRKSGNFKAKLDQFHKFAETGDDVFVDNAFEADHTISSEGGVSSAHAHHARKSIDVTTSKHFKAKLDKFHEFSETGQPLVSEDYEGEQHCTSEASASSAHSKHGNCAEDIRQSGKFSQKLQRFHGGGKDVSHDDSHTTTSKATESSANYSHATVADDNRKSKDFDNIFHRFHSTDMKKQQQQTQRTRASSLTRVAKQLVLEEECTVPAAVATTPTPAAPASTPVKQAPAHSADTASPVMTSSSPPADSAVSAAPAPAPAADKSSPLAGAAAPEPATEEPAAPEPPAATAAEVDEADDAEAATPTPMPTPTPAVATDAVHVQGPALALPSSAVSVVLPPEPPATTAVSEEAEAESAEATAAPATNSPTSPSPSPPQQSATVHVQSSPAPAAAPATPDLLAFKAKPNTTMDRIATFYQFYNPSKLEDPRFLVSVFKTYKGHEEILIRQLTSLYGPEPYLIASGQAAPRTPLKHSIGCGPYSRGGSGAKAASSSSSSSPSSSASPSVSGGSAGESTKPLDERIRAFYTYYNPEKLEDSNFLPTVLKTYRGHERILLRQLVALYGPEPQ